MAQIMLQHTPSQTTHTEQNMKHWVCKPTKQLLQNWPTRNAMPCADRGFAHPYNAHMYSINAA